MSMDLSGHISDLITVATEMKKQPSSDKKALNKTIARLEEAALWAKQINQGNMNGVVSPQSIDGVHQPVSANNNNQHVGCTCPEGAIDSQCPVHGTKT